MEVRLPTQDTNFAVKNGYQSAQEQKEASNGETQEISKSVVWKMARRVEEWSRF